MDVQMGAATKPGELFCPLFPSYTSCCSRTGWNRDISRWSPAGTASGLSARLAEGAREQPTMPLPCCFHSPHATGYQNLALSL